MWKWMCAASAALCAGLIGCGSPQQATPSSSAVSPTPSLSATPMQEGAVISSNKEPANEYPTELGQVHWGRDFKGALAEGERTGKPILVLFQEVPG